jgi:hypothetical protein
MTDATMVQVVKQLQAHELYMELIRLMDDPNNTLTDEALVAIEEAACRIMGEVDDSRRATVC